TLRRQVTVPRVVDDHRRVDRSPLTAGVTVVVVISPQVQPSARPDLEKPYWKTESAIHSQQPADQRGGPAHLIGLWWLTQCRAQRVGVVGRGEQDLGPRRPG